MAEIIGFLMVFGVLGLIVGTLATGVIRIIGFAVLVSIALIAGAPVFRQLSLNNFLNPTATTQAPTQSPAETQSFGPQSFNNQQPSGNLPSTPTQSFSTQTPAAGGTNYSQGTASPQGTTPTQQTTIYSPGTTAPQGTPYSQGEPTYYRRGTTYYQNGTAISDPNQGIRGAW